MKVVKITVAVIGVMIVLLFGTRMFFRHEMGIHNRLEKIRTCYIRGRQYKAMHKPKVDVSSLPALKDEEDAWYTKYHIIAHAGGGIEGRTYTNSVEAWEYSYSRGTRIFDADCTFTTDGKLVLRHGWNDNLEQTDMPVKECNINYEKNGRLKYEKRPDEETDFKTFMQRKIFYKYSPMSCEMMIEFMQKHDDLYVATDMKDKDVVKVYTCLVETAKQMSAEEILNRIIVSIYDYKNYQEILKIYPFRNFAIRQYDNLPHNYYELASFCVENNIHVANVMQCYMDEEGIRLLTDKGIHVFTAVVDYVSDMKSWRKLGGGVSGCVSNFLYEDIYSLTEP